MCIHRIGSTIRTWTSDTNGSREFGEDLMVELKVMGFALIPSYWTQRVSSWGGGEQADCSSRRRGRSRMLGDKTKMKAMMQQMQQAQGMRR